MPATSDYRRSTTKARETANTPPYSPAKTLTRTYGKKSTPRRPQSRTYPSELKYDHEKPVTPPPSAVRLEVSISLHYRPALIRYFWQEVDLDVVSISDSDSDVIVISVCDARFQSLTSSDYTRSRRPAASYDSRLSLRKQKRELRYVFRLTSIWLSSDAISW